MREVKRGARIVDEEKGRTVAIEVTPERPGEYQFTCGMYMYKAKLNVR